MGQEIKRRKIKTGLRITHTCAKYYYTIYFDEVMMEVHLKLTSLKNMRDIPVYTPMMMTLLDITL